jgi:hypothetical protein
MTEIIQWPPGEFTIQAVVDLNRALPEKTVRKKLAEAIKAKGIVQTKKGDQRTKGQFKVVKRAA